MTSNAYHFITHWRVKSTVKEVADILNDAVDLARWWPSVYLDVKVLEPGDEHGLGKVVSLYTKGWLPYTLRWDFRVTNVQENSFTLQAWGDFDGRGIWTFEQDGSDVNVTYDWKINAEKPLLRYFSFIMKPIFSANHRWAMQQGEKSLKLELARRHATTEAERAQVPAPPPATTSSSLPLFLGIIGVAAVAGILGYWVVRRRDA
jgi:hypothetical protein